MLAVRTRQPVHLLAGMSEDDYVTSGLAEQVTVELERLLVAEDKRNATRKS